MKSKAALNWGLLFCLVPACSFAQIIKPAEPPPPVTSLDIVNIGITLINHQVTAFNESLKPLPAMTKNYRSVYADIQRDAQQLVLFRAANQQGSAQAALVNQREIEGREKAVVIVSDLKATAMSVTKAYTALHQDNVVRFAYHAGPVTPASADLKSMFPDLCRSGQINPDVAPFERSSVLPLTGADTLAVEIKPVLLANIDRLVGQYNDLCTSAGKDHAQGVTLAKSADDKEAAAGPPQTGNGPPVAAQGGPPNPGGPGGPGAPALSPYDAAMQDANNDRMKSAEALKKEQESEAEASRVMARLNVYKPLVDQVYVLVRSPDSPLDVFQHR